MDRFIGKKLDGRYQIEELLGIGGMANVYKAYDILESRTVAVKILRDEFMANEEFVRRFKNESKAIALLAHPNIVKVYDVSFTDKVQFIVMEYIDGVTLKEYIGEVGTLPWKEALHFTVQILRALQHAHDKGIIHRDIKPQNIMLLPDKSIKVMDFGIARFSRSQTKTITDKAIGSVHYISPEQASGQEIDDKTDIYSVGVMLYEMLTGQLPFEAASAISVAIMQLQSTPKRICEINADVPEGLEDITFKAMQKDVTLRYKSAAEMLSDIAQFKRNPSIQFEYKYFVDDEPTKFIKDSVSEIKNEHPAPAEEKKPFPVIPVLLGVAGACVVATLLIVVIALFGKGFFGSKGADIELPNLVGFNIDDAQNLYPKLNITIETSIYDDNSEYGTILEQKGFKAGIKVKEDTTIYVIVSNGPRKVAVPSVSNMEITAAEQVLKRAGFVVTQVKEPNEDVLKDYVIKVSPEVGTIVAGGSTVTVYISSGPAAQLVKVPTVKGMLVSDAKAALQQAGLKYSEKRVDSTLPIDVVISQSEPGSAMLAQGSVVTLSVSTGVKPKNEITIKYTLPEWMEEEVTYEIRVGGIKTESEKIIPSLAGEREFVTSGTGKSTFLIKLDGRDYILYSIDYDERTYTIKKDYSDTFKPITSEPENEEEDN